MVISVRDSLRVGFTPQSLPWRAMGGYQGGGEEAIEGGYRGIQRDTEGIQRDTEGYRGIQRDTEGGAPTLSGKASETSSQDLPGEVHDPPPPPPAPPGEGLLEEDPLAVHHH